jgi:hypothetical protein
MALPTHFKLDVLFQKEPIMSFDQLKAHIALWLPKEVYKIVIKNLI